MLKKILSTAQSRTCISICNEEDCPTKIKEIKDASIAIILNTTADFMNLNSKIIEHLQEKNYSPCKMLKHPPVQLLNDNSRHKYECTGIREVINSVNSIHIFIEIVSSIGQFTEDARVLLCEITEKITVNGRKYMLRGVVSYKGREFYAPQEIGHYISYCKRHNGDWELYDDLHDKWEQKHQNTEVRPHLLYYSI